MVGRAVEMMVASIAEGTPVIKRAAKTIQKRQPLS
jgi:hypothetical protein